MIVFTHSRYDCYNITSIFAGLVLYIGCSESFILESNSYSRMKSIFDCVGGCENPLGLKLECSYILRAVSAG